MASKQTVGWESLHDWLDSSCLRGEVWDGYGRRPPSQEQVGWALGYARHLQDAGGRAPSAAYHTADGEFIFDWNEPGGVVSRVQVVGPNAGVRMAIYPERPPEFNDVSW